VSLSARILFPVRSLASFRVRIQADLILSMKQQLAELIAEQTGKSVEQIHADSDRDHWFTAAEALEYGFIDKIVTGSGDVTGGGGTDD
jgi:ATP-dependent Clp protease protease subunit